MSSRRKHSKSRHGCLQCKAAHVKCDLAQPTCGKCTKSGKICQFQNLLTARFSNTTSASYNHNQHPPYSPPPLITPPPQDGPSLAPENVQLDELELMHHFSTITYSTMAHRNDLRRMWQLIIPCMALKQKYLLHSLFSITALHMSLSQDPPNRPLYIDKAIRYNSIALQEFTSKLQDIKQEERTALFTCATLTVIFAFSLPILRPEEEPSDPVEGIVGLFTLLRGISLMIGEMWTWVRDSEIGPLFVGRELDDSIILSPDVSAAIKLLDERNRQMANSEAERETYAVVIQGLEECFKLVSSMDRGNGMVFKWPISLSQEYISFLRSRQQMALVILAHYAVILHEIRDTWWVMGWGSKLIQELNLVVEDEWRSLLVWPLDKIASGR